MYFSPEPDTFMVTVQKGTGVHQVTIDPKISVIPPKRTVTKRDIHDDDHYIDPLIHHRNKRAARNASTTYTYREVKAKELTTFITVETPATILIVRDVRFRLVITLPNKKHLLKVSRFFMIMHGKGDGASHVQYGNLFFRQDQPHIDLFVFFSVFFSCFFLFLAKCALWWKLKQAVDTRRSRHLRQIEMECMASRPFANVLVSVDRDPPVMLSPPLPRKQRLPKLSSKYSIMDRNGTHEESPFNVVPIALETTDDGIANVGTVFFQLPGGANAPLRATLGSTLMTLRVLYPNAHLNKNTTRRRISTQANNT